MTDQCFYSRMNNGAEPPTFNPGGFYYLPGDSRRDAEVVRTGAELNALQKTVCYDMTKRWIKIPAQLVESSN